MRRDERWGGGEVGETHKKEIEREILKGEKSVC